MTEDPTDKRRHERYPVQWTVELEIGDWHDARVLTSGNLSRGGLFLRFAGHGIEPGMRLAVTLRLPDGDGVEVEGEVVHVIRPHELRGDRKAAGFGLRFADEHATDLLLLESMAASHTASTHSYQIGPYISLEAVVRRVGDEVGLRTRAHQLAPKRHPSQPDAPAVGTTRLVSTPDELRIVRASEEEWKGVDTATKLRVSEEVEVHLTFDDRGEAVEPDDVDRELAANASTATALRSAETRALADEVLEAPTLISPPDGHIFEPPPAPPPGAAGTHESPALPKTIVSRPDVPSRPVDPSLDPRRAVFGVDLGATNCSIALALDKRARVLRDGEGQTLVPSVVCYPEPGKVLCGWPAKQRQLEHPTRTIFAARRLLDRRFADQASAAFLRDSPVPYRAGPAGEVAAVVFDVPHTMVQVCADLLRHLAEVGEAASGIPVRRIALSAPVGGSHSPLRVAAALAGLEVVAIIDEPWAAAIGAGLGGARERVAVFDLGGGSFHFTVLDGGAGQPRIVADTSDPWLGGDDLDLAIAGWVAGLMGRAGGELRRRLELWQRLLALCERARRKLSFEQRTTITIPGLTVPGLTVPGLALERSGSQLELDRRQLEALAAPLIERAMATVERCLLSAEIAREGVERVVMVGGVCHMPMVHNRLAEYFDREISLIVDPQQAVVSGNALHGRSQIPVGARNA